jgi:hypothetical protein
MQRSNKLSDGETAALDRYFDNREDILNKRAKRWKAIGWSDARIERAKDLERRMPDILGHKQFIELIRLVDEPSLRLPEEA